jgi:molybdate transport system substrate-binding protein
VMRAAALAVVAIVLAACGSPDATASGETTELRVFAASSLAAAFSQLGDDFEEAHDDVRVSFTFGSSTDLAERIAGGDGADVFASANEAAMGTVATAPGVERRTDFATNHLVIVTPLDNPAGVVSLDSLTRPMAIAIGAEGTPIGDYTRQVLDAEGIEHAVMTNVVANEADDASIVAKVESGEADAGIVYTSDIAAPQGEADSVEIPADVNVTATYPIASVNGSDMGDAAAAFVRYVTGPDGQAVLERYGFGPPPG